MSTGNSFAREFLRLDEPQRPTKTTPPIIGAARMTETGRSEVGESLLWVESGHSAATKRTVRMSARLSIALATLLISGCGQNLGTYAVGAVRVTTDVPLSAETAAQYGDFLEVRLASKTNLTALADGIDAVYVDADFCPLRNPDGVIAFGPFGDGGEDLGVPSVAPALRQSADGDFHYRIYVPIAYRAGPATKPGQIQLPRYDLRETKRDLCLRLFAPGYNILKSRSETVRVPANVIFRALESTLRTSSP